MIQINKQLVVCGFHRSGTSMAMQAIFNAGLRLGDDLISANPSNPDGHFEDRAIVDLHNDILASARREWHSSGAPLTDISQAFSARAADIVSNYNKKPGNWGFKDPRTCLFLDWWTALLDDASFVLIYRDFRACYKSLRKRQAQALVFNPIHNADELFFWSRPQAALQLWLDHNRAVLDFCRRNQHRVLLVAYEDLLGGFDLVTAVNNKFNFKLDVSQPTGIRRPDRTPLIKTDTMGQCSPQLIAEAEQLLAQLDVFAASRTRSASDHQSLLIDQPQQVPGTHATSSSNRIVNDGYVQQLLSRLGVATAGTAAIETRSVTSINNKQGVARATTDPVSLAIQRIDLLELEAGADTAFSFAQQQLEKLGDNVRLLLRTAALCRSCGHSVLAERYCKTAATISPHNVVPIKQLGLLARERGDALKAVFLFARAITINSENAELYLHFTRALKDTGRTRQAKTACLHGLEIDSKHRWLKRLYIQLLLDEGNTAEAKRVCRLAMSALPDDATLTSLYSQIVSLQGYTDDAMKYFHLAVVQRMRAQPDYLQCLLHAIEAVPQREQRAELRKQVARQLEIMIDQQVPPAIELKDMQQQTG